MNDDQLPEATELQKAYEEQRQKVARCAVEWCRAYITLIQMGRDLRAEAYETMRRVNPRLFFKVDDREVEQAELVARALFTRAMGLLPEHVRELEGSDPAGDLGYGRAGRKCIGEVDRYTTADPANEGRNDQEPYRSLGRDELYGGERTPQAGASKP